MKKTVFAKGQLKARSFWLPLMMGALAPFYVANADTGLNDHQGKRLLTVSDMIERPTIAQPYAEKHFVYSDKYIFFRTLAPDTARDHVVDTIWAFDRDQLKKFARSGAGSLPPPRKIYSLHPRHEWEQIQDMQVVEDGSLLFLGARESGRRAVFRTNPDTGETRVISAPEDDVISFNASGSKLAYYRALPSPLDPIIRTTMGRGNDWTGDLVEDTYKRNMLKFEVVIRDLSTGQLKVAPFPAVRMRYDRMQSWPSATGRHVVFKAPVGDWPDHWARYQTQADKFFAFRPEWRADTRDFMALQLRERWMLWDVETGKVRPLMDAPTGWVAGNDTPERVYWTTDDRHVFVSNSYLPLTGVPDDEFKRRERGAAIARIDVQSGKATALLWEPTNRLGVQQKERITDLNWDRSRNELSVAIQTSGGQERLVRMRQDRGWRQETAPLASKQEQPVLQVTESLTQRPVLSVMSDACRCPKTVFDPDPAADQLALVGAKKYEWTDQAKVKWLGGLLLPPGYKAGNRYPLVVQTHGFDEKRFIMDGPAHSGYAAQALASAGMVVLQVPGNREALKGSMANERVAYAEGYRAAIQSLIDTGIADPDRIGILAFSAAGVPVTELLARFPTLVRAAVYADASTGQGYMSTLLMVNAAKDHKAQREEVQGKFFFSRPFLEWWKESYISKAPSIRTATRIESYTATALIGNWELYGLLRGYGTPATISYLPDASHRLFNPRHREASQGGTVDWMRFWLQGYEDPSPAKKEHYRHWQEMREQQKARPVATSEAVVSR